MSTITRIPLALLVEDMNLYPRTRVSDVNVGNILSAIRAGRELPPPVVDEKTRKIVDGVHRYYAWRKHLGSDGEIDVELRAFNSDADMFKYAVESNVSHGLPLQEIERRRVTLRMRELGVDDDTIAATLHIPEDRVEKILVHTATTTIGGGELRLEPLKRPHFWMQGQSLTPGQVRAMRSAPGTPYTLLIRQLRQGIQFGLIDPDDTALLSDLRVLAGEINSYLSAPSADDGDLAGTG